MLGTADLIAFAATTRPVEALAFYTERLGLELVEDSPFALVFNAGGTTLRIQKVEAIAPQGHTVLGWAVANIEKTIAGLADRGVTCERFDALPQDELGVWLAPDGTRIAWLRDPDGNLLSLTEHA